MASKSKGSGAGSAAAADAAASAKAASNAKKQNNPWLKYRERMGHRGRGEVEGRIAGGDTKAIKSQMSPAHILPKPNVVRIEVMDGMARREYMGGFQGVMDHLRESMTMAISGNAIYEPFYGILADKTGNFSITLNAQWNRGGSKSGFATMSELLSGNGKGGVIGVLPWVGESLAGYANKLTGTVEKTAQFTMGLAGVNNNTTGSTTIKKFGGASIECPLSLQFNWYMPEQENMCRIALKRLFMMAYVRPVNVSGSEVVNAVIEGIKNGTISQDTINKIYGKAAEVQQEVGGFFRDNEKYWDDRGVNHIKAADQAMKDGSDAWTAYKYDTGFSSSLGHLADMAGSAASVAGNYLAAGFDAFASGINNAFGYVTDKMDDAYKYMKDLAKNVAGDAIDMYNKINSLFGGEITANPLPVRVTIGHYMDLEPMVIDNVKITMSKEQFISPDGTHLPILVTADVSLSYWMQPGPTKDFISLLGNEMFEQYIDRNAGVKQQSLIG